MWLSIAAFTLSVIFLLRTLEIIHTGQPFLNSLICLLTMLASLSFLPAQIPQPILFGFAWVTLGFVGGFLVIDSTIRVWKKMKQAGLFEFRLASKLSGEFLEICQSLEKMAANQIGALIVIERQQPLDHFIAAGLRFDGDVKAEVIVSLFDKNSAVHDGAMIISKGRIKALRVILPLTTRADIPMGIGTRHRSAIGLTEETDAVVLIASEERGIMSVAYRGNLAMAKSQDQLICVLNLALKGKSISENDQNY